MASQLTPGLAKYLEALEPSGHPVLAKMEEAAEEKHFPIIGPQCGRILAIMAKAIGARRVFEMGSGFGYSTLWFASAVGENGEVVHTDGDPENTAQAREYLSEAGFLGRVRFLNGDATELLMKETEPFDVILIDIDKEGYPLALQAAVPKLRVGGLLMAHNTVWGGKVVRESDEPTTKAIRQYNWEIMVHAELLSFVNPVHDGLSISLKVTPEDRMAIPVAGEPLLE